MSGFRFYRQPVKSFLPPVSYTGVDRCSPPGSGVIKADLEKGLPASLQKEEYDAIFMLEIIELLESFRTLLEQCQTVLSKTGRIVI